MGLASASPRADPVLSLPSTAERPFSKPPRSLLFTAQLVPQVWKLKSLS